MSNSRKFLSSLRTAVTVLMSIVIFLFSLAAVCSFVFRSLLTNKEIYVQSVHTDAFSEEMTSFLREDLEAECLFYDLPFSVLDTALSAERIDAFVVEYALEIHSALLYGAEIKTPEWDATPFIDAVQQFFDSLPAEEKPFDQTAAVTVGTELSDYSVSFLKAGMPEVFLKKGYQLLSHPMVLSFQKTELFLWAIVACAVGLLLCSWGKWKKGLYTLFFSVGMASFTVTASFWLLTRYNIMERIALADSPLKLYIETIFNEALHRALSLSGVCFLIVSGLFLLTVILTVLPFGKRNCTQKVHTDGIDEHA